MNLSKHDLVEMALQGWLLLVSFLCFVAWIALVFMWQRYEMQQSWVDVMTRQVGDIEASCDVTEPLARLNSNLEKLVEKLNVDPPVEAANASAE